MESNNFRVKEEALAYLGKEVKWSNYYPKGMVVGYSESKEAVIVSFPNNFGWSKEALEYDDVILIHSPLNVTFWNLFSISWDEVKEDAIQYAYRHRVATIEIEWKE